MYVPRYNSVNITNSQHQTTIIGKHNGQYYFIFIWLCNWLFYFILTFWFILFFIYSKINNHN